VGGVIVATARRPGGKRMIDLPTNDVVHEYDWSEAANLAGLDLETVKSVVYWYGENDFGYADVTLVALLEMEDGGFGVLDAWCDTTGWDCQSGARFTAFETLDDAIKFGIGDQEREWFGIKL
jgi:hypothetical protein